MSMVYIVLDVQEVDGGHLPDQHRIQRVFSSYELANGYCKSKQSEFKNFEINEWELDDENT